MTVLEGVHGTVCNATQYQQSQQSYNSGSPWISCLTHRDTVGLVSAAQASLLSCFCVVVAFIWIGVRAYMEVFPDDKWTLFQKPADIYVFFLFVFDFLQATGGILNIRWAHKGIVTTGPYCTAQGILEQIGGLGVALITLLLAVHTFAITVLPVGLKARGVAFTLVCLACVFIILWAAISPEIDKNYETPTPYWCWINPQYLGERLGGEYIWTWIALFASTILYIPVHYWAKGFWSVDEEYKFHWWTPDKRVGYAQRRSISRMLLYPLAYSLIALPISITRLLLFSKHHVSSAATFSANSMFHLSGTIHFLLFLIRPKQFLFPHPKENDVVDGPDMQLALQDTQAGPAAPSRRISDDI